MEGNLLAFPSACHKSAIRKNCQSAFRPKHALMKMPFSRTAALEYLRRAQDQNRLAHAYLISGPPDSGKHELAADLASLVNGTPSGDVFSARAREIFVARPESKSRRIVIEQIRSEEHTSELQSH